jgi:hypothetical protein
MAEIPASPGEHEARAGSRLRRGLELSTKITSAALGTFYVLGLLCLNVYGARLALPRYGMLKAQYEFAGFWLASLWLMPSLLALFGAGTYGPGRRARILLLSAPFLVWYLVARAPGAPHFDAAINAAIFGFIVLFLTFFALPIVHALTPRLNIGVSWNLRGTRLFLFGCLFICFLLAYVYGFAAFAYERIPSWLGGGKPQRARIWLKPDASMSPNCSLEMLSELTLPLDVLLQTEKVLYVRTYAGSSTCQIKNGPDVKVEPKQPDQGLNWELSDLKAEEMGLRASLDPLEATRRQQLISNLFRLLNLGAPRSDRLNITAEEWWSGRTISDQYEQQILASVHNPDDWQCDWRCYWLFHEFRSFAEEAAKEAGGQPSMRR